MVAWRGRRSRGWGASQSGQCLFCKKRSACLPLTASAASRVLRLMSSALRCATSRFLAMPAAIQALLYEVRLYPSGRDRLWLLLLQSPKLQPKIVWHCSYR